MSLQRPRSRNHLSLGRTMVVILIVSLSLGPLMTAVKTQRAGLVIAAVVFDVVILPAVASIVLAAALPPGPDRTWCVKALWLTPLTFLCLSLVGVVFWTIVAAWS